MNPETLSRLPDGDLSPECLRQDDEIFHTARLVNCGHFFGVVLNDFLGGVLGQDQDIGWLKVNDDFIWARGDNHLHYAGNQKKTPRNTR